MMNTSVRRVTARLLAQNQVSSRGVHTYNSSKTSFVDEMNHIKVSEFNIGNWIAF